MLTKALVVFVASLLVTQVANADPIVVFNENRRISVFPFETHQNFEQGPWSDSLYFDGIFGFGRASQNTTISTGFIGGRGDTLVYQPFEGFFSETELSVSFQLSQPYSAHVDVNLFASNAQAAVDLRGGDFGFVYERFVNFGERALSDRFVLVPGTYDFLLSTRASVAVGDVSGAFFDGGVTLTPVPVPEPATLTLFGLGLLGVGVRKRMMNGRHPHPASHAE